LLAALAPPQPVRIPLVMRTMDSETAGKVADVVIATALLGAAVFVIRTPALRRLAWGLTATALTATVPAWLKQEVRQGWHARAGHSR
jgi:hypothetical protein